MTKAVINFLFWLVIAQFVFATARLFMSEGFIVLIPFILIGAWTQMPKVHHWRETRKFRRELDEVLRSSTDRSTL